MKDWKTTIPGVLAGIAQISKAIWPAYGQIADMITGVFLAVLGTFAAQVKPQ